MIDLMPRPKPPHLYRERTRHGGIAYYVRVGHGRRIRIREAFGTAEFWAAYREAVEGRAPQAAAGRPKPQTLAWLIDQYRHHSAWAALSPATRRQRENIYRHVTATAGDKPIAKITERTIREGRERRAAKPHSANNFLKAMRGLFGWAVAEKKVPTDPTRGIPLLAGKNDEVGFHTWTEEEVERYEAHWPVGTRERLALDLLLYTGLRRGDVVRFGRPHVRNGEGTIRTEKTGEEVTFPILGPLAASIAATKTGGLTYLATASGRPFVKEGFGNWFRDAARLAGVPGSAHGLRKAGAVRAAENGATVAQLMAMYGWTTEKMAVHYIRAANRRRLAREAAKLLLAQPENTEIPHLGSGAGLRAKN